MINRYEIKKIKSAQRVLEVLEYFTPDRRKATVMDIARSMGYPQSSTSELLNCLVSLGYLHCDRQTRVYWPSARVALLGAWVSPTLFRQGNLLQRMDKLADQTGASVVLTAKVDIWAQCVHVVSQGPHIDSPSTGSRQLLTHCPAGKLLLSTLAQDHVRKLIHRINADIASQNRSPVDRLVAEIREVGIRKVVGGTDGEGAGLIAMLLPPSEGVEPLAIELRCASDYLSRNLGDYIQILKSTFQDEAEWRGGSAKPGAAKTQNRAMLAA